MASMTVTDDELTLTLTTAEKVAGLHGDLRVPITAVRDVSVERDALAGTLRARTAAPA